MDLSGQTAMDLLLTQLEENDTIFTISRERIELVKLLRVAGSSCHRLASKLRECLVQHSSSQTHQDMVDSITELESSLSSPLTMKELARVTVRKELGSRLLHVQHLLPLPVILRDYLLIPEE